MGVASVRPAVMRGNGESRAGNFSFPSEMTAIYLRAQYALNPGVCVWQDVEEQVLKKGEKSKTD